MRQQAVVDRVARSAEIDGVRRVSFLLSRGSLFGSRGVRFANVDARLPANGGANGSATKSSSGPSTIPMEWRRGFARTEPARLDYINDGFLRARTASARIASG
jgi:hypothetical protein